ncbi:MAG: hypothetical protein NC299_09760 [Lachnospiraceae bacterium]|nr:hypothetical protein [Ruminococcus sp.]MCM1275639.1 hypothetical protein [Lachnospiraceae bacterium]
MEKEKNSNIRHKITPLLQKTANYCNNDTNGNKAEEKAPELYFKGTEVDFQGHKGHENIPTVIKSGLKYRHIIAPIIA